MWRITPNPIDLARLDLEDPKPTGVGQSESSGISLLNDKSVCSNFGAHWVN